MKVSVSKVEQKDKTVLILIEVNDELFASSREGDDCITLTEDFCKEWLNQGEPEEIELTPYMNSYFWSVNDQMIEVVQNEETSLQPIDEDETFEQFLSNENLSVSVIPKEELEELEELWNSTNNLYEIVCEDSDSEEDEFNSPYYGEWQKAEEKLYAKVWYIKNQLPSPPNEVITYTDMYGNIYDSLKECEAGEKKIFMETIKSEGVSKKHKLVKKQDLPKKVDFEMLVNSPFSIWNGGYEKGETQSINETVQQGELAAQNLELFISLMKNPKFATKASFEIEKLLKKSKTI